MTAVVEPRAEIDGVVLVAPVVHGDERGTFVEHYRRDWLPGAGVMVQANSAERRRGALAGLHHHLRQADLWYVVSGRVRVVLHDLRRASPTEGATLQVDLAGRHEPEHHHALYIPPGVAHGYVCLTDVVLTYLVDRPYDPGDELGVAWDDPAIGADWGLATHEVLLSERDRGLPLVADLPAEQRPAYGG